MHFGFMTTALLFIMSSGYWTGGIIPALLAKILLLKATILLGPPIALGAFVVGQGSGLLIGKILGISYILKKWKKLDSYHHNKYIHSHGWKHPFHYHKHLIPFHNSWEAYPETHVNYNQEGSHDLYPYHQPYQYDYTGSDFVTDSDPYHYYGTNYVTTVRPSYSYNAYNDDSDDFYTDERPRDTYSSITSPSSSSQSKFEVDDDSVEDETTYSGNEDEEYAEATRDTDVEESNSYKSQSKKAPFVNTHLKEETFKISTAENFIIEQFLKSTEEKPKLSEEKKLDILADLLHKEFQEEYVNSMHKHKDTLKLEASNVAPLQVEVAQVPLTVTSTTGSIQTKSNSTLVETVPPKVTNETKKLKKKPVTIKSSLVDVFSDMDAKDWVPDSLMSWLFSGHEAESAPNLIQATRTKRETLGNDASLTELKVEQVTESFVQDIKNLFRIVSFLDMNRCLEKMICEIHSRRHVNGLLTEYEMNIITAFRIMNPMMPLETSGVDSTTIYRQAAELGQKSLPATCMNTFQQCGFSTHQIIQLGNIANPTPNPYSVTQNDHSRLTPNVKDDFLRYDKTNTEDLDMNSGI